MSQVRSLLPQAVKDIILGRNYLTRGPRGGGGGGGGRGGGLLNKVLYKEVQPRGPTPYPFIYHFRQERNPFRIPSIDKRYLPLSHAQFRTLHPF